MRLNTNCPGVSCDDTVTFFVPGMVFKYSLNSLATLIRVGRFSDVSETILSPTAFPPGGPHLTAQPVILSHFCSSWERELFHIFSRANTSLCPSDFLSAFFCNSIVRFAILPLVERVICLISENHLKYEGSSHSILCMSSVRVPTAHSIE